MLAIIADPLSALEEREKRSFLFRALSGIDQRGAAVLCMRNGFFGPPMTLDACAKRLKVGRERVRQIEAKNIRILRRKLAKSGFRHFPDDKAPARKNAYVPQWEREAQIAREKERSDRIYADALRLEHEREIERKRIADEYVRARNDARCELANYLGRDKPRLQAAFDMKMRLAGNNGVQAVLTEMQRFEALSDVEKLFELDDFANEHRL